MFGARISTKFDALPTSCIDKTPITCIRMRSDETQILSSISSVSSSSTESKMKILENDTLYREFNDSLAKTDTLYMDFYDSLGKTVGLKGMSEENKSISSNAKFIKFVDKVYAIFPYPTKLKKIFKPFQ